MSFDASSSRSKVSRAVRRSREIRRAPYDSRVIIGYRRRTAPYADEIEPYVHRDDKVSTQYDKLLDVHADGATYGAAL